jgi:hypothetical protein
MEIKDIPTEDLVAELDRRREEELNSIKASPLAFDIMEELDDALKTFGAYQFGDKGPHEVMNINGIRNKLKELPIKEIAETLSQVIDNYKLVSTLDYVTDDHEATYLVSSIIGDFDYLPESDFMELLRSDDRFEY